jgi:hypothetical protein
MLIGFSLKELENMRSSDFIKLILYGKYLDAFCLITMTGEINFADFDPLTFRRYKRPRRDAIRARFIATLIREYTWRSEMMAKNLSPFDDTNEVVANYDPHKTHSRSRPIPEPMINDTTSALVVSRLNESQSCFDKRDHLAQSNPTPPFLSSLAPDMMIAASRGVSPFQLEGELQVFAECPPDPREGADSDSCTDILVTRDNKRTPATHVPSTNPIGTRTTDVPFENLTAVPPDT